MKDDVGNIERWDCVTLGLETKGLCDCVTGELLSLCGNVILLVDRRVERWLAVWNVSW